MHEIAMGTVQFQNLEPGLMGAPRRLPPGRDEVLHLRRLQRPRHRPALAMGDRARRHWRPGIPILDLGAALERAIAFPGTARARLAAGMAELDAGDRILLLDEAGDAAKRRDELVIPDAEIADRPAAAAFDLGGFHDHEAGAAGGELAGIHQMPVGRKTFLGGILVHRRHHDAVLQRDAADGHRRKQQHVGHRFLTWRRYPGQAAPDVGDLVFDADDIRATRSPIEVRQASGILI